MNRLIRINGTLQPRGLPTSRKEEIASAYKRLGKAGSVCVRNADLHTDALIRKLYIPPGYFTDPFETMDTLELRLKDMYSEAHVSDVQSIALFQCVKQHGIFQKEAV